MRKVWSVSTGSYSDYRVRALFATKEQAEEATKLPSWRHNEGYGSDYYVEEFTFYAEGETAVSVTEYQRMADLWDDGTITNERDSEWIDAEFDHLHGPVTERPKVEFVRAPVHKGKGGRLEVRGSDKTGVDKAFSDRVAEWKAIGHLKATR